MILAVESASTDPSVAVADRSGTVLAVEGWIAGMGQGRDLFPRLLALLAAQGRPITDATAVAVGIGPGSFTGLRVGMALSKGIAAGLGVPIVGIPSLVAWLAADPEAEAAVGRAGAHEVYLLVRGETEPGIVDAGELPERVRTAPTVAPAELAERFGLVAARSPSRAAGAVATLGGERLWAAPAGDDLATLEPMYLRLPRGIEPRNPAAAAGGPAGGPASWP